MNRKNLIWITTGLLLTVLLTLLIVNPGVPKENESPLPPDVVQLKDGSFISLSHFYEMGYLAGTFATADYIAKQDVFKEIIKASIDLDTIFDKCHKANKAFFDQYNKTNEQFNNTD